VAARRSENKAAHVALAWRNGGSESKAALKTRRGWRGGSGRLKRKRQLAAACEENAAAHQKLREIGGYHTAYFMLCLWPAGENLEKMKWLTSACKILGCSAVVKLCNIEAKYLRKQSRPVI